MNNGKDIQYFYDHTGARTKKVVDGVITEYHMAGDLLASETTGGRTNWYRYDSGANLISANIKGKIYLYVRNAQNDIIGLIDTDGNEVVRYTYDSWGKLLSIDGDLADTVGVQNPFRYRGYYYDNETGMYYVKSRYYDPEIRRFISTDKVVSNVGGDIRGYNLYSYSFNNPVNMSDPSGNWPKWISKIGNAIKNTVNKAVAKIKKKTYSIYYNATKWHFEDRAKKNGKHPSYKEVTAKNSNWKLLPKKESVYHDNGVGKAEKKYITNDGREAVFDGDTLAPVTDPRYIATYNYVPLYKIPENGAYPLDYIKSGASYAGHFVTDVLPYWLTGNSNTREQFEEKIFIFD